MPYRLSVLLGVLVTFTFPANGQDAAVKKGQVIILRDTSVTRLLQNYTAYAESRQSMPGYRIQIYFGTDRTQANEIRTAFIKDHESTEAYLLYHQPNFKVRVGDYKTRLEAMKALQLLSISYPGAFLVKDEVHLPKL